MYCRDEYWGVLDSRQSRRSRTHTITKAKYKCHVDTEELDDGLMYEQFEGANESFTEHGFPTARDMSMKRYKDEVHAPPIRRLYESAGHHLRSFLFVHSSTDCHRLTFQQNGCICLRCGCRVSLDNTWDESREINIHFLSEREGRALGLQHPRRT